MTGTVEIQMEDVEIPFDDPPVSAPESAAADTPRVSRRPEEPTTLHWVHDVERAFTALLWHHPRPYIDRTRSELDLEHISVPAYREIIKALFIVFGEIGEVDFACVVHCVRELGAFEECGRLEGLDEAYSDGGRCPEGFWNPEAFFRVYLGLIRTCAAARQTDPYQTVRRFTGYGFLRKNKLASKPGDMAAFGSLRCPCCGNDLQLRAWPNGQELKLKAEPERK